MTVFSKFVRVPYTNMNEEKRNLDGQIDGGERGVSRRARSYRGAEGVDREGCVAKQSSKGSLSKSLAGYL